MLSDWKKSHWKGRRICHYQCTGTQTFTTNQTFGHNCKFECTKFCFSFLFPENYTYSLFLFRSTKPKDLFLSIKCSSSLKLTPFHFQGQSVNKEFMTSLERVLLIRPLHVKHGVTLYEDKANLGVRTLNSAVLPRKILALFKVINN